MNRRVAPADEAPGAGPADGLSLTETAYRSLRRDIIRGERAPGERLRLERLRTIYGIGPTPLREALQRLSAERLVLAGDNRGFTVAALDSAEFADLNIARTAIEKEALRLSIAAGDDDWEARIVAASYLMAKEDTALASSLSRVPDSWEAANATFHRSLVDACGSNALLRVRAGLHDLCERHRRASVYQRIGERDLGAEHRAIADAVLARDTERACALLEQHFARTASSLAALIETDHRA